MCSSLVFGTQSRNLEECWPPSRRIQRYYYPHEYAPHTRGSIFARSTAAAPICHSAVLQRLRSQNKQARRSQDATPSKSQPHLSKRTASCAQRAHMSLGRIPLFSICPSFVPLQQLSIAGDNSGRLESRNSERRECNIITATVITTPDHRTTHTTSRLATRRRAPRWARLS